MVPAEYSNYFITMATVAATLFGLIFLAVSITPEAASGERAPLERQMKATASYLALSNPLLISLFALLPHQEIGPAVAAIAGAGLLDMLVMGLMLLRSRAERPLALRNSLFVLVGLVLYGLEVEDGVRLLFVPSDNSALYGLATLMIFIVVFGLARAWELVGGRHFRIRDWLSSPDRTVREEPAAGRDDAKKDGGK